MSNKAEELATWEKHTKGIGSKLLAKFGFKGRLGANETGINAAIEVNLRPSNVGLGYGDADAPKSKAKKPDDVQKSGVGKKKKLSDAELLADSQGWKRTKYTKVTTESHQKRTTDTFMQDYEKLISASKDISSIGKIIDMRQAEAKVVTDLADLSSTELYEEESIVTQPRLGQELLYNLTSIVNVQKMKVASDSRKLLEERNLRNKYAEEIQSIQLKKEAETRRVDRLKSVAKLLSQLNQIANEDNIAVEGGEEAFLGAHQKIAKISKLVQQVFELGPEEFAVFGIGKVLPGILTKILQSQKQNFIDNVHPLKLIHASWQDLTLYFEHKGLRSISSECSQAFERVTEREFLPIVRRYISSWDAVNDCDRCVDVMEAMKAMLPLGCFEETVDVSLMPRINQAVQTWNRDKHPLHSWLLPWIPLLSSKLSAVYPDVRRKLVDYMRTWHAIDPSSVQHIAPWVPIFDRSSMENFLSKTVIPKLVELTRRQLVIDPSNQSLEVLNSVLAWSDVLPSQHLTCLLAGEFFPKWLRVLIAWLNLNSPDFGEISLWYQGWKSIFPKKVVEDETTVLPILDFALDIMKESAKRFLQGQSQISSKKFEAIIQSIEASDYYALIKKTLVDNKFREKVQQAQATAAASAASATTNLKDILEILAEKHNVEFIPKFGRSVEGKSVWQFGKCVCYMENNVVFVPKRAEHVSSVLTDWTPISLEDLLVAAAANL